MAQARQPRAATLAKREQLLDATEQVMLEEGYAAVSSRRVAARAGIGAPLVHYHFPTLDDLLVAVVRRRAETHVARMADALATDEPLRAWWRLASDRRGAGLLIELIAAANHRPALRAAVGELAQEVRTLQVARLDELAAEYGIDPDEVPPALVAAAVQGLAFGLVADETAGYDTATDEVHAGMDALLDRLERRRRPGRLR